MLEYLGHVDADKAAKLALKWQRNVMATKCLFYASLATAVIVFAIGSL